MSRKKSNNHKKQNIIVTDNFEEIGKENFLKLALSALKLKENFKKPQ